MELRSLGFDDHFNDAFETYARLGLTPGRVLLQYNHIYTVATHGGELHAQCSGRLRHMATVFAKPGSASVPIPKSGECKWLKRMAPQVGLEPTTLRLTAECSAIELLRSVADSIIIASRDPP
jgi:hypothetical protein